MSNMWAWDEVSNELRSPKLPGRWISEWTTFHTRDHHGQWFLESGFDKDAVGDSESIRDWNLRAVYGAFNAMKNRDGADKHRTAVLTWVAFIGGPRESRRLMGDLILTQDDVVSKKEFADGCVPSTWSIDLHYPKDQYERNSRTIHLSALLFMISELIASMVTRFHIAALILATSTTCLWRCATSA